MDSNVFVSAFTRPQGLCGQIWRKALHRQYQLRDDSRIINRLRVVTRVAEFVKPASTIGHITDDEDDNRILECAVAGGADLIVSGDQHLRRHYPASAQRTVLGM